MNLLETMNEGAESCETMRKSESEEQQKMQYSGNRQHPPADAPPKASDVVMGKVPGLTVLHRSGGSVAVETVDLLGRVLLKKPAKADHGRG